MKVVNDVLDFSKIEAGKIELDNEVFNIKDYCQHVSAPLAAQAKAKGLAFVLEVSESSNLLVSGDRTKWGQVLRNLLSNAIKFTEQGKITVEIFCARVGGRIETTALVSDTGIGIPSELSETVFEPFRQEDASITRNYGGTGLGLAICKKLAGLMGGDIEINSTVGVGSQFRFSCFLNPADPVVEHVPQKTIARSLNILVAEDNQLNQKIIGAMLTKLACVVTMAANGLQAVKLLNETTYDLVLMDMQMPQMDGLNATKIIRSSSSMNRQVPIVALTANATEEHKKACYEAGMQDFLTKPLSMRKLEDIIHSYSDEDRQKLVG